MLASVKTPNGNTTSFTYTGSVLTQITNPLSQSTNITSYTAGGLPETVVDPNSVTTTLTHSPRQWLLSSVSTTGGALTTTYTYDAAGNLTKKPYPTAPIWPIFSTTRTGSRRRPTHSAITSPTRWTPLATHAGENLYQRGDADQDPFGHVRRARAQADRRGRREPDDDLHVQRQRQRAHGQGRQQPYDDPYLRCTEPAAHQRRCEQRRSHLRLRRARPRADDTYPCDTTLNVAYSYNSSLYGYGTDDVGHVMEHTNKAGT